MSISTCPLVLTPSAGRLCLDTTDDTKFEELQAYVEGVIGRYYGRDDARRYQLVVGKGAPDGQVTMAQIGFSTDRIICMRLGLGPRPSADSDGGMASADRPAVVGQPRLAGDHFVVLVRAR